MKHFSQFLTESLSRCDMEDLLIIVPRQSINQQTQTDPLNISLYMDRSTQVDIDRTSRKRSNSRKPSLSRSVLFRPVNATPLGT